MGNCLDRTLTSSSDESDESTVERNPNSTSTTSGSANQATRPTSARRHRRRARTNSSNRYVQLTDSSMSISSSFLIPSSQNRSIHTRTGASSFSQSYAAGSHHHHNHNNHSHNNTLLSSSLPNTTNSLSSSFSSSQQVYYLSPNVQRTADQLTEEEQIKLLKRMTLIQQLPSGAYDENKKNKECVICMIDFEKNDTIKYLPCMHTFHESCIDTWLLRSLICPSCMEPVDAGLLAAFE